MLRDRWKIVAISFVVVTVGVAVGVAFTPPVYRAIGTIEIRKQATEVVPVDALFQYERISDQYLQTEYGTLRSRALLQRTLAEPVLGQRLRRALVGEAGTPDADAAPTGLELADEMADRVLIDPLVGSRIVRVGFDSPDPMLSADVVNSLIAHYVDMRREAAAAALGKLGEQADSVRVQLLASEEALQAYVEANGLGPVVIAGTEGETVPQERLRRLQQELTEAEADAYRAAALSSATRDRESATESELLRSLRVRIAELEGEYARTRSTFTDSFPRMRQLRSELAQLDSMVTVEQRRVSGAVSGQHEAALHRRDLLRAAVLEQRTLVDGLTARLAEYDRRLRDVESLKQLYTVLQQKRKEASLSAALATMDVAVLDAAPPPLNPLRPRPKRDLPLAALTGLLLGIGLAFVREYTDGTFRTPEEMGSFGAAPLLASIPTVQTARWSAFSRKPLPSEHRWHRIDDGGTVDSPIAEAFRYLRTSVLFDAGGELPRTLLVTSSLPGEGKTTVSSNFAMSLSMLGHRVLLVDADLRRPSLHRVFDLPEGPGLAECLDHSASLGRVVRRNVRPGLDLILAGRTGTSPADLLSGDAIPRWLSEEATHYDVVVLDAPAIQINAPDARILAHAVEGVLLVVRSGSTPRDLVRRSMGQTPNLAGVVLNQIDPKRLPEYYGEYGSAKQSGRKGSDDDAGAAAALF